MIGLGIRAGAMAAGRSWPYIKAAAMRVGNWINTRQAATGGGKIIQVGKPQSQFNVASKYINSPAGSPWKQYINQKFPTPDPSKINQRAYTGGKSGREWMDNFKSSWDLAKQHQKGAKLDWIEANKGWLSKEASKAAGSKARNAANKAREAIAKDPAAQAAAAAAAAAATAALVNKILNPEQIVVNPNQPTPTPGPRPRPSPKPKPGPRPKPRPGPKEEPEEENPDTASSCDDDVSGTAQSKPKYREVTMFTQYGTITVKGPA